MSAAPTVFDRNLVDRRRSRVAAGAGKHDFLLQRVADDFAERLAVINRTFAVAACIGAHHGALSRHLRTLPQIGLMIDVERSAPLLAQCEGPRVAADEELLPFADASLDLVVSALSLQLVNDLPGALKQIARALKPDGLFLGAMIGGESLKELRAAWLQAESEIEGGASPRVAPMVDVRDAGALLQRAGLALPVTDTDLVTVTYASPLGLMRELKAMGASNALSDRRKVPVRRATFARAAGIYAERFAKADGRVPATFEIITMTAWAPHESQQKPLRPGSARARLADALAPKRPAGEPGPEK